MSNPRRIINFRIATIEDLNAIVAIKSAVIDELFSQKATTSALWRWKLEACDHERIAERLKETERNRFLITPNVAVGSLITLGDGVGEMNGFYVRTRHQGIGSAMLQYLEAAAPSLGCRILVASTFGWNQDAQRVLAKHRYTPMSRTAEPRLSCWLLRYQKNLNSRSRP